MLAFRAFYSLERLTIGRLRSILMLDTGANPIMGGEIQRNGANVYWHNGTTAQQLNASGGSAPADADYLVGTAHAGLSAEIVVGTTPGGELGNTWASPTVDATHAGSAHHAAVTLAADADTLLSLSTQELGLDTQTANTIFAGPTSGGAADPTFRSMVAADLVAHGASSHTDRTRRMPLTFFLDTATDTALPSVDAHGSIAANIGHWHLLDAISDRIRTPQGIVWPSDLVTTTEPVLNILFAVATGGNNLRFVYAVSEFGAADTAATALVTGGGGVTVVAPAVADTLTLYSLTLTSSPTAGKTIAITFGRDGGNAADDNNSTMSVYAAWIEYTSDM